MSFGSDDHTRAGSLGYRMPGVGLLITQSCGRCGAKRAGMTGARHRVYGAICVSCADAIRAAKLAKEAAK